MKKIRNIQNKNQQGAALLFAIGILSLLMFLGLAFVTNAVLSQKIAHNNASRSQGKLIGKTALNRLTAHLMYFQREELKNSGSAMGIDYSNVYSRSNTATSYDDQIPANNVASLLTYTEGSQNHICTKPAKWQFIKNASGDEITARFAYWVLPVSDTLGTLDLNQVEKGNYHYAKNASNPTPRTYRLGKDIAELNVQIADSFFADANPPNATAHDCLTNNLLVADLESYYNIAFDGVSGKDKEKSMKWLRKWFTESGNTRNDQEVYFYKEGTTIHSLNRFDLARTDWNTGLGLGDAKKNSSAAVERLLMLQEGSNNNVANPVDKLRFCSSDAKSLPDIGLPYLKRIGTDSEDVTFVDSTGNKDLLALRKQVAANLIDYCDDDDIPTSDIAAANWSVTDSTKQPQYTGNEKTPYINELAFGGAVQSVRSITPTQSGYNGALEIKLKPELIAELIDIYGITPQPSATLSTQLNYKITLNIKSTWDVAYQIVLGSPFNRTINGNIDSSPDGQIDPVSIEQTDIPVEITFSAPANGYFLSAKDLPEFVLTKNYQIHLTNIDTIKTNLKNRLGRLGTLFSSALDGILSRIENNIEIKTVSLKSFSVQVSGVEVAFQGIVLKSAGAPVDFVSPGLTLNTQTGNLPYLFNADPSTTGEITYNNGTLSTDAQKYYNRFYAVGLEAKDPRQNLNVGDWQNANAKIFGYNMSTADWASFEINPRPGDTEARPVAGLCNTVSNPSGRTNADAETVTDPAWKSATEHLSTAYIANKPMKSLWELGAIHRGIAWQTLNIKKAPASLQITSIHNVNVSPTENGYTYAQGDGILLDQVKLVDDGAIVSSGKMDLNRAVNDGKYADNWDKKLFSSVFAGVSFGHKYADLHTDYNAKSTANTVSTDTADAITGAIYALRSGSATWESRAELLSGNFYNGYGNFGALTDAEQEEFVGKTINLLKAQLGNQTPETDTLKAVVVVQTIKDIGGEGSDVEIIRFKQNKDAEKKNCQLGRFDAPVDDGDSKVYFDEITSEVKMLVTYKLHWEQTDPSKKSYSIKVQQIEYID